MVDLTTIAGLDENQTAGITAIFESELTGLKSKVEELLGEKKGVQQQSLANETALEDARKAAVKAHEEKLIADGETEKLKSFYEEQLAETTAKLTQASETSQAALLSRDRGDILSKVKNLIHEDYRDISSDMLSNMLKVSYNDEGQPIATFEKDGEVVANNIEEFSGWAKEQPSMKKILNGVDSSGAGANQSQSGGAANGDETKNNLAQRLKAKGL